MTERQKTGLIGVGLVVLAGVYLTAHKLPGAAAYVYFSCAVTAGFGLLALLCAARGKD